MNKKAFTLIELLIVVAIIAILAAIAVPNFLEAQTRSKVARVRADHRTLITGLESYATDWQKYPPSYAIGNSFYTAQLDQSLKFLTTPIPYLTSVSLPDPFGEKEKRVQENLAGRHAGSRPMYMYFNYEPVDKGFDWASIAIRDHYQNDPTKSHRAFMVWSCGPDRTDGNLYWVEYAPEALDTFMGLTYDPTNGTMSWGDIARLGGNYRYHHLNK